MVTGLTCFRTLTGDLNSCHLGQGSGTEGHSWGWACLALSPGLPLGPLMCWQKMLSSLWFSLVGKKIFSQTFFQDA